MPPEIMFMQSFPNYKALEIIFRYRDGSLFLVRATIESISRSSDGFSLRKGDKSQQCVVDYCGETKTEHKKR